MKKNQTDKNLSIISIQSCDIKSYREKKINENNNNNHIMTKEEEKI